MAFATCCLPIAFLLFVGQSAACDPGMNWDEYQICLDAESCAAKIQAHRESKAKLIAQVINNTEFMTDLFSKHFSDDEDMQKEESFGNEDGELRKLLNKYENDFADIENKFQVKMQILNETRTITNVIETEKNKLNEYQNSRFQVMNQFKNFQFDYFLHKIFPTTGDYDKMIRSPDCGDCNGPYKNYLYDFCLKNISNQMKKGLDEQQLFIKNYVKEVERVEKTRRWYFINNARVASKAAFNNLNRTITTKQVEDYYTPKLVPVYNEFVTVYENYHNLARSDNLTSGVNIIRNLVKFVLDTLKDKVDPQGDCDYLKVMEDVINIINTYFSPYKKFPIWSLDDFAAKYIRPINNIKDVDRLINVLEDAIRASRKSLSDILDIEDYAKPISTSVNRLYQLAKNKNCSMIRDIQTVNFAAYRVIECVMDFLDNNTPDIIELYLKTGRGADAISLCELTVTCHGS